MGLARPVVVAEQPRELRHRVRHEVRALDGTSISKEEVGGAKKRPRPAAGAMKA